MWAYGPCIASPLPPGAAAGPGAGSVGSQVLRCVRRRLGSRWKPGSTFPQTYLPEKFSGYRAGKLTVLDKGEVLKSLYAWSSKENKKRSSSSPKDTAACHSFLGVSCDISVLPAEFMPRELEARLKLCVWLLFFLFKIIIYIFIFLIILPAHPAAFFIYDLTALLPFTTSVISTRGKNVIGLCMTHGSCEVLSNGSSFGHFNWIEAQQKLEFCKMTWTLSFHIECTEYILCFLKMPFFFFLPSSESMLNCSGKPGKYLPD